MDVDPAFHSFPTTLSCPPRPRPPPLSLHCATQHLPTLQSHNMSPTTASEKEWARIKVQSLLSQILHHVAPRPSDVVIVGACCQCLHGGQPWESWECCIMTHNGVPVRGGGVVVSRAATCLWIPQAKSVSCYSSWLHGTAGGNFAGKKAWKGCSYGTPALKVLVCLQHST